MNAQLKLRPHEVPLGALMFPHLPGEEFPSDRAFRPLVGGVPSRRKWYTFDIEGKTLLGGAGEDENFKEDVYFTPVKSYVRADAPPKTQFAVFIGGRRAKYDKYPDCYVEVTKLADGTLMSVGGTAYDHWLRRLGFPEDAVLIPHSECEYERSFDDAVVLPLKEYSDAMNMLAKAGAAFYYSHARKEGDPDEFYFVWLPPGWKVIPSEQQYTSARFEHVVDNTGMMRARVAWVEQHGRDLYNDEPTVRKSGAVSLENTIKLESGEIVW